MKDKYAQLRDRLDEEIRKGQTLSAQNEIRTLNLARIPREFSADFANLARRLRLPKISVQILRPIVRSDRPLKVSPTPKELAAYAAALSRLGAIDEALEILEGIKETNLPEVPLQIAFAHIFRWDYAAAIPWLKRHVKRADLSAYDRLVGKINLAAAYVAEGAAEEGEELLLEVISVAIANEWDLLAVNAHETRAQLALSVGDLAAAKERLSQASTLAESDKIDGRFIEKWQTILRLKEEGATPGTLGSMAKFRSASMTREDWEAVRLCDYYVARETRDEALFTHVYAGTQHRSFRRKMEEDLAGWFDLPERYNWQLAGKGSRKTLDVSSGRVVGQDAFLKAGQGPHRLLQALAKDFYRPFLPGAVFSSVFPGEYYDPKSSPKRIEQLVIRLRKWLKENRVPLAIEVHDGSYRLAGQGAVDLVVPVLKADEETTRVESGAERLAVLKKAWPYKAFSTRQAAELLQADAEKTRQLLNDASKEGALIRVGQGRATLFRFAK